MPHSRTHSTSNAISIPAIRSALSEAKRFRVGGRQLRPELERALRLLVRRAPSSRDNPADIADRDMGVAVGWSANHCCTYSLQLRGQLAAGRPDFVRHLRFLPRALGESFRADDRGRFAQATPQALRECAGPVGSHRPRSCRCSMQRSRAAAPYDRKSSGTNSSGTTAHFFSSFRISSRAACAWIGLARRGTSPSASTAG
jgi:hypothetical protein